MTDTADPGSGTGGGRRMPCVGALVADARGRLLVVRRVNDPGRGLWSVPGGRVEPGETPVEAVVREVAEETGLRVVVTGLVGVVERAAPGGGVYVIEDHRAQLAPGADPEALRAGDDASDAAWVPVEELERLPCVDGLVEALRGWRVVP